MKDTQHAAIQDLTKAHIESFDQAVTDGLNRVVQVSKCFFTVLNNVMNHFIKTSD